MFAAKTSRESILRLLDFLLATLDSISSFIMLYGIYIFHNWSDMVALVDVRISRKIRLLTIVKRIMTLTGSPTTLEVIIFLINVLGTKLRHTPFNFFFNPMSSNICLFVFKRHICISVSPLVLIFDITLKCCYLLIKRL